MLYENQDENYDDCEFDEVPGNNHKEISQTVARMPEIEALQSSSQIPIPQAHLPIKDQKNLSQPNASSFLAPISPESSKSKPPQVSSRQNPQINWPKNYTSSRQKKQTTDSLNADLEEVHLAPSSGQMPESYCRDSSESSLSKSNIQGGNDSNVPQQQRLVNNNKIQWQKVQTRGNKAPRGTTYGKPPIQEQQPVKSISSVNPTTAGKSAVKQFELNQAVKPITSQVTMKPRMPLNNSAKTIERRPTQTTRTITHSANQSQNGQPSQLQSKSRTGQNFHKPQLSNSKTTHSTRVTTDHSMIMAQSQSNVPNLIKNQKNSTAVSRISYQGSTRKQSMSSVPIQQRINSSRQSNRKPATSSRPNSSQQREIQAANLLKSVEKVVEQTNTMSYALEPSNPVAYPKIEFKVDCNFPIKILDGMIEIEEKMQNGFSLYNRGSNLQKSLIDPKRVKEYLQNQEAITTTKAAPKLQFLHEDGHLNEDLEWQLMMDYFKENPSALLDAMPTPPGEEEDAGLLADFRTGLTPKKSAFKFGTYDNGPNRPPQLNMGPPNLNSYSKVNHQRTSSALSQRSNTSSNRGTPNKSLPKIYQPGSSRPNSSSRNSLQIQRQNSVRSVSSTRSNKSNHFNSTLNRDIKDHNLKQQPLRNQFVNNRLQHKQNLMLQQEKNRLRATARAKQLVKPPVLLPPVKQKTISQAQLTQLSQQ